LESLKNGPFGIVLIVGHFCSARELVAGGLLLPNCSCWPAVAQRAASAGAKGKCNPNERLGLSGEIIRRSYQARSSARNLAPLAKLERNLNLEKRKDLDGEAKRWRRKGGAEKVYKKREREQFLVMSLCERQPARTADC